MKVKEIKRVMSSSMSIDLCIAQDEDEAIAQHSQSRYTFNYGTSLSDYYGNMKVIFMYPVSEGQMEIWAVKESKTWWVSAYTMHGYQFGDEFEASDSSDLIRKFNEKYPDCNLEDYGEYED